MKIKKIKCPFYLFSAFLFFIINIPANAQDQQTNSDSSEIIPMFRWRALIVEIDARVLEHEVEVIWNETHRKLAIPGYPVGIKLVGANIIVAVQFTPFIRRHGNVLVAQGQIWIDDPDKGMTYYASIQSIPLEFDEPIYFFPLGSSEHLDSSIEIVLTVNPYSETNIIEAQDAVKASN
ncbi:MAG: hypothetical protein FWC03_03390 [Treponema sp.]|nr:hypothetical protein [Treponema sp.]